MSYSSGLDLRGLKEHLNFLKEELPRHLQRMEYLYREKKKGTAYFTSDLIEREELRVENTRKNIERFEKLVSEREIKEREIKEREIKEREIRKERRKKEEIERRKEKKYPRYEDLIPEEGLKLEPGYYKDITGSFLKNLMESPIEITANIFVVMPYTRELVSFEAVFALNKDNKPSIFIKSNMEGENCVDIVIENGLLTIDNLFNDVSGNISWCRGNLNLENRRWGDFMLSFSDAVCALLKLPYITLTDVAKRNGVNLFDYLSVSRGYGYYEARGYICTPSHSINEITPSEIISEGNEILKKIKMFREMSSEEFEQKFNEYDLKVVNFFTPIDGVATIKGLEYGMSFYETINKNNITSFKITEIEKKKVEEFTLFIKNRTVVNTSPDNELSKKYKDIWNNHMKRHREKTSFFKKGMTVSYFKIGSDFDAKSVDFIKMLKMFHYFHNQNNHKAKIFQYEDDKVYVSSIDSENKDNIFFYLKETLLPKISIKILSI